MQQHIATPHFLCVHGKHNLLTNESNTMTKIATVPQIRAELIEVLRSSLYPGAANASIEMVLAYCTASNLDVMQKPVHIVPMWDKNTKGMRDVIMPGVNLYRVQAMRSGNCAGISEPEFGPEVREVLSGQHVTFPEWCRVTIKRLLPSGQVAEFTAREYWMENYAVKGGQEKSLAPNAMWTKRPRGQIAKCAQAQALRMAFPEIASQNTAEEMEGKTIYIEDAPKQPGARPDAPPAPPELLAALEDAAAKGLAAYSKHWEAVGKEARKLLASEHIRCKATAEAADAARTVEEPKAKPATPPAAKNASPVTYDQVMKAMVNAADEEKLQEAADLIGAVESHEERANLSAAYQDLLANFKE
jgi:phage recombination protein Bet